MLRQRHHHEHHHHRPRRRGAACPRATRTPGGRAGAASDRGGRRRRPPCPPSPPSLHAARETFADRLLLLLGGGGGGAAEDDVDDARLAEGVEELVLEAAAALHASRDWPLLDSALRERESNAAAAAAAAATVAPKHRRVFLVAGLGSLGQYRARLRELRGEEAATTPDARRRACPRAGMRLFQLALARLLLERERGERQQQQHQQQSQQPPPPSTSTERGTLLSVACDPEYDALDLVLLRALGFEASLRATAGAALRSVEEAAAAGAAEGGGGGGGGGAQAIFCYMPLCPRDAYDEVLGRYWSAKDLPRLQILGTSFGAQGESAALIAAIAAFGGSGGGGRAGAEPAKPPSEKQALLAAAAPDGVLVEIPAPDFACHGVGVALHAFDGGEEAAGAFFARSGGGGG